MKSQKRTLLMYGLIFIAVAFLTTVSAYTQQCLGYSEKILFSECNPAMNDFTCDHSFCQVCTNEVSPGVYCPAHTNYCAELTCNQTANSQFDITPPNMTINSPENGVYYNSRKVLVDVAFTEPASVYYKDNTENDENWKRLCSNCDREFINDISFDKGFNNITIRVTDRSDNAVEDTVFFYVDTDKPRIRYVEPRKGFTDGTFYIDFIEAYPLNPKIYYGVPGQTLQMRSVNLNSECYLDDPDKDFYKCEANVSLESFDGQEIAYYVVVEDFGGLTDETREEELYVDLTSPVINSVSTDIDGKYVYFSIDITEPFLEEVGYSFYDERGRYQEKRLCTKLVNGLCEKKVSFRDGVYNITLYVTDEVGFMVGQQLTLFIDSTKPKIKDTMPDSKFGSGYFSVTFEEEHTKEVLLHYGPEGSILDELFTFDVGEMCTLVDPTRNKYLCETTIDVTPFENEELSFYYSVEDMSENKVMSRADSVIVDTLTPVLHNPVNYYEQGEGYYQKYIYFSLNVTEPNLDKISYIDYSDSRPRLRSLCSKLSRDGLCEKKVRFSDGSHTIGVFITDDAGNELELDTFSFSVS